MRQGGQHLRRIPIKSFSPNVDFMKALPLAYPSVFPGRVAYARKSNSFLRGVVVCVVATKGGSTMNDYMKSLQKHFDRQEHNELDERIRCVREELRQDLGTESRRRLLHLLDAQNTLLVDSTLMSFTAGFKLAWGIATELEADFCNASIPERL